MPLDLHIQDAIDKAINDHTNDHEGTAHGGPFALKGHELGIELPSLQEIDQKISQIKQKISDALGQLNDHVNGNNDPTNPHPEYWLKSELLAGWPSDVPSGDNNHKMMTYEEHLEWCDYPGHENLHGNRTWNDTAYDWYGILEDLSVLCDSAYIRGKIAEHLTYTFEEGDSNTRYGDNDGTVEDFVDYVRDLKEKISFDFENIKDTVEDFYDEALALKNEMNSAFSSIKSGLYSEMTALDNKQSELDQLNSDIDDFIHDHPLV